LGNPTGLLIAKPNANPLFGRWQGSPQLCVDIQSIRRAFHCRELKPARVYGANTTTAAGFFRTIPETTVIRKLSEVGSLTVRIAYNLFTQKQGEKRKREGEGKRGADFWKLDENSKIPARATTNFHPQTGRRARCWSSRSRDFRGFATTRPKWRRKNGARTRRTWLGVLARTRLAIGCPRNL